MKIVKAVLLYVVMFVLMFGAWQTLSAQNLTLTGKWKFNQSSMVLTENTGTVFGTWQEAIGSEACPVTGTNIRGIVNLHITCNTYHYNLKLVGEFSDDGNEVKGDSLQNDLVPGKFTLERNICLLPEGCR